MGRAWIDANIELCDKTRKSLTDLEKALNATEEAAKKENVALLAARRAEVEAAKQGIPPGARYEDYLQAATALSAATRVANQAVRMDGTRDSDKDAAVVEAQGAFQKVKDAMTVYYQDRAAKGLYDIDINGKPVWELGPDGDVKKFQCGPYIFEIGKGLVEDPKGVYQFPTVIYEAQASLLQISTGVANQLGGVNMDGDNELPCPREIAGAADGAAAQAQWGGLPAQQKQDIWGVVGLGLFNFALKVGEKFADKAVEKYFESGTAAIKDASAVAEKTYGTKETRDAGRTPEYIELRKQETAKIGTKVEMPVKGKPGVTKLRTYTSKDVANKLGQYTRHLKGEGGELPAVTILKTQEQSAKDNIAAGVKYRTVLDNRVSVAEAQAKAQAAQPGAKSPGDPTPVQGKKKGAAPSLEEQRNAQHAKYRKSQGLNGGTRRKMRRNSFKRKNARANRTRQRQGRKSRRY
jgi:hypothetical protein